MISPHYDKEGAKERIAFYSDVRQKEGLNDIPLANAILQDEYQPCLPRPLDMPTPVHRRFSTHDAPDIEQQIRVIGVISNLGLPPYNPRPKVQRYGSTKMKNDSSRRDRDGSRIEQWVQLDGCGLEAFMDSILGTKYLTERLTTGLSTIPCRDIQLRNSELLTFHCRYMEKYRNDGTLHIPFEDDIDPKQLLHAISGGGALYVHTEDNTVEYRNFYLDKDTGRWKTARISPSAFEIGDIVEVMYVIRSYKTRDGDWVSRLILRGIVLLDKFFTIKAQTDAVRAQRPIHRPTIIPHTVMKRKYVYDEDEENRAKRHEEVQQNTQLFQQPRDRMDFTPGGFSAPDIGASMGQLSLLNNT